MRGEVAGNKYYREFGSKVVQIHPGTNGSPTIFLHILTAVDIGKSRAPEASCEMTGPGRLRVRVDGIAIEFSLPFAIEKTDRLNRMPKFLVEAGSRD